jgi:hypothetical protein
MVFQVFAVIKCPGPSYHLECYRNLNPGHPSMIAAAWGPGIAL